MLQAFSLLFISIHTSVLGRCPKLGCFRLSAFGFNETVYHSDAVCNSTQEFNVNPHHYKSNSTTNFYHSTFIPFRDISPTT